LPPPCQAGSGSSLLSAGFRVHKLDAQALLPRVRCRNLTLPLRWHRKGGTPKPSAYSKNSCIGANNEEDVEEAVVARGAASVRDGSHAEAVDGRGYAGGFDVFGG
jgi:hypothetical protein